MFRSPARRPAWARTLVLGLGLFLAPLAVRGQDAALHELPVEVFTVDTYRIDFQGPEASWTFRQQRLGPGDIPEMSGGRPVYRQLTLGEVPADVRAAATKQKAKYLEALGRGPDPMLGDGWTVVTVDRARADSPGVRALRDALQDRGLVSSLRLLSDQAVRRGLPEGARTLPVFLHARPEGGGGAYVYRIDWLLGEANDPGTLLIRARRDGSGPTPEWKNVLVDRVDPSIWRARGRQAGETGIVFENIVWDIPGVRPQFHPRELAVTGVHEATHVLVDRANLRALLTRGVEEPGGMRMVGGDHRTDHSCPQPEGRALALSEGFAEFRRWFEGDRGFHRLGVGGAAQRLLACTDGGGGASGLRSLDSMLRTEGVITDIFARVTKAGGPRVAQAITTVVLAHGLGAGDPNMKTGLNSYRAFHDAFLEMFPEHGRILLVAEHQATLGAQVDPTRADRWVQELDRLQDRGAPLEELEARYQEHLEVLCREAREKTPSRLRPGNKAYREAVVKARQNEATRILQSTEALLAQRVLRPPVEAELRALMRLPGEQRQVATQRLLARIDYRVLVLRERSRAAQIARQPDLQSLASLERNSLLQFRRRAMPEAPGAPGVGESGLKNSRAKLLVVEGPAPVEPVPAQSKPRKSLRQRLLEFIRRRPSQRPTLPVAEHVTRNRALQEGLAEQAKYSEMLTSVPGPTAKQESGLVRHLSGFAQFNTALVAYTVLSELSRKPWTRETLEELLASLEERVFSVEALASYFAFSGLHGTAEKLLTQGKAALETGELALLRPHLSAMQGARVVSKSLMRNAAILTLVVSALEAGGRAHQQFQLRSWERYGTFGEVADPGDTYGSLLLGLCHPETRTWVFGAVWNDLGQALSLTGVNLLGTMIQGVSFLTGQVIGSVLAGLLLGTTPVGWVGLLAGFLAADLAERFLLPLIEETVASWEKWVHRIFALDRLEEGFRLARGELTDSMTEDVRLHLVTSLEEELHATIGGAFVQEGAASKAATERAFREIEMLELGWLPDRLGGGGVSWSPEGREGRPRIAARIEDFLLEANQLVMERIALLEEQRRSLVDTLKAGGEHQLDHVLLRGACERYVTRVEGAALALARDPESAEAPGADLELEIVRRFYRTTGSDESHQLEPEARAAAIVTAVASIQFFLVTDEIVDLKLVLQGIEGACVRVQKAVGWMATRRLARIPGELQARLEQLESTWADNPGGTVPQQTLDWNHADLPNLRRRLEEDAFAEELAIRALLDDYQWQHKEHPEPLELPYESFVVGGESLFDLRKRSRSEEERTRGRMIRAEREHAGLLADAVAWLQEIYGSRGVAPAEARMFGLDAGEAPENSATPEPEDDVLVFRLPSQVPRYGAADLVDPEQQAYPLLDFLVTEYRTEAGETLTEAHRGYSGPRVPPIRAFLDVHERLRAVQAVAGPSPAPTPAPTPTPSREHSNPSEEHHQPFGEYRADEMRLQLEVKRLEDEYRPVFARAQDYWSGLGEARRKVDVTAADLERACEVVGDCKARIMELEGPIRIEDPGRP